VVVAVQGLICNFLVASGKEPYNDDDGDDTYDADQKTQRGYCKSGALSVCVVCGVCRTVWDRLCYTERCGACAVFWFAAVYYAVLYCGHQCCCCCMSDAVLNTG
jgi:hypothetical protein